MGNKNNNEQESIGAVYPSEENEQVLSSILLTKTRGHLYQHEQKENRINDF